MVDFKYYLNNDYFKIGRFGEKHVQKINIVILVCLGIIALTLLFNIILYSSTNYHSLDDLEDYLETYRKNEARRMDKINLALKIMPSYNTERNAIYMTHSNDIYSSQIPGSLSLIEKYNMNHTFFFVKNTKNFFPKLEFTKETIPVGNSISMCFTLFWDSKNMGNNYELMKQVTDFPQCQETKSGQFIWNQGDTMFGVDIPIWKQQEYDIDCVDDSDCSEACLYYNAEFYSGTRGKKCYGYTVLDNICLTVKYDKLQDSYKFAGGCFGKNQYYTLSPAVPNQVYTFDNLEVEVRNVEDPILKAGEISNYTYSFAAGFSWLGSLLGFLFFVSIIALLCVAGMIVYYRKKYSDNNLLEEKGKSKASRATGKTNETTVNP